MSGHRRKEKEEKYRALRRNMIISPVRHDPFADGKSINRCFADSMKVVVSMVT